MTNRQIIETALFTTIAVVLTFISIPAPFPAMAAIGLKIDLSPIFILLLFYRQGTKSGYIALFITMFFNAMVKPTPVYIGQVAYSLALLSFYYSSKKGSNFKLAVIATIIIMTIFNYVAINPIYTYAFSSQLPAPYFEWILSLEYFKFVISIFPFFNLMQWGINGLLINFIVNKNEVKTVD